MGKPKKPKIVIPEPQKTEEVAPQKKKALDMVDPESQENAKQRIEEEKRRMGRKKLRIDLDAGDPVEGAGLVIPARG